MSKLYIANIHLKDTPDLNILSALGIQNSSSPLTQSILQSLINCTNLLFIITDPKGIIQLFSPGAELILGYKPSEVKNKLSVIDLCDHQDLRARTDELNIEFKAKLKTGFETLTFHAAKGIEDYCALKCLSKEGRKIQIELSITVLQDDSGNHFGYMFTGTECHFPVQKEKKELDSFFSLSPNLMFIAETDFSFLSLNPLWQKLLGYTVKELSGLKYIDLVHPLDVKHTQEALLSISPEHSFIIFRNRFLCKKGTYLWIEWDVKLTDDKIYALGRNIESIILDEDSLSRSKEAGELESRAKSNFLAHVSHEIKNPLNAIIGFSELLLLNIQDTKQLSQITAINKSGKNLLTLLNEILDLSKLEAGQMKLVPVPVNLNSLFMDIESMFSLKTSEKGLYFTVDRDHDITYTYMLDENRLRQILVNLVGNAIKFTEKGFISMAYHTVLKKEKSVELSIVVQDTGFGIPLDQQKLIFEPFHQQERQDFNKFGGTGLGLSISKRLTEMMGGKIIVLSSPGKGSIFKLVFPDVEIQSEEEDADLKLDGEIAIVEVTALTDEQKHRLPAVIRVLENDFLPLNYNAIKKQLIEQIEMFGIGLKTLGETNSFQVITDYGKKICQYVDNFEIDKMMKTLKSFPELIEKIKSYKKYAPLESFSETV